MVWFCSICLASLNPRLFQAVSGVAGKSQDMLRSSQRFSLCVQVARLEVDKISFIIFLFLLIIFLVLSNFGSSLLNEGLSLTTKLWKSDKWLLTLSDDENVGKTGGELVSSVISDVDDLIGTWVVFNVHEHTNTTNIVSCLDEDLGAILEFHNAINLTSGKVKLKENKSY